MFNVLFKLLVIAYIGMGCVVAGLFASEIQKQNVGCGYLNACINVTMTDILAVGVIWPAVFIFESAQQNQKPSACMIMVEPLRSMCFREEQQKRR